ncbi:MAG TPA: AraC family transcriptional regulator [Rhizobiaceae bacterium]|nr:AraC family transcriptional regulator [Rhizobiaceae bacterium]
MARPSEQLRGIFWEGTYAQAAAGALHPLIEAVKTWQRADADPLASAITGISWNDRPDGFRFFAGTNAGAIHSTIHDGRQVLSLPAMRLASIWHGPEDGDVVQHYGAMLEWIERSGEKRDTSILHHREEYPSDIDLAAPPVLRLMLPLVAT